MRDNFQLLLRRWRVRQRMPLLVWLFALGLTLILYARVRPAGGFVAYANEVTYTVAADAAGLVSTLEVGPQDGVRAGQIVARLDGSALELQARAARTELERVRADLERRRVTEGAAAGDVLDTQRRFADDRELAHVNYLQALGRQEEDRVRVHGIELQVARLEQLHARDLASAAELDRLRTEQQALQRRIDEAEPLLAELSTRYQEAERRHGELATGYDAQLDQDTLVAPYRWAIEAQEVALEQVALEVNRLVLRAPADGRVDVVLAHAGEYVTRAQPILTIVNGEARELVAYVDEVSHLRVQPGMHAAIERTADGARARTTVLRLGARMTRVPERSTGDASIVRYALPVFLAVPEGMRPTPGEMFTVRLIDD